MLTIFLRPWAGFNDAHSMSSKRAIDEIGALQFLDGGCFLKKGTSGSRRRIKRGMNFELREISCEPSEIYCETGVSLSKLVTILKLIASRTRFSLVSPPRKLNFTLDGGR